MNPTGRKLQAAADLCRELSVLSQIGLPWEPQVARACRDIDTRVAQQVRESDQSWSSSNDLRRLGVDVDQLPPSLRGLIDLSVESGAPGELLAELSPVLSRAALWRRTVAQALVYPLVVAACALTVLVAFSRWYIPLWQHLSADLFDNARLWNTAVGLSQHWVGAAVVAGVLLIAIPVLAWTWQRRAGGIDNLPRRIRSSYATALFLHVLARMVHHRVTLDRSLPLAAQLTGDLGMMRDAQQLSQAIRTDGEIAPTDRPQHLPRRLPWLLTSSQSPEQLARGLQSLAEEYAMQGDGLFETYRTLVPLLALLLIGGGTTSIVAWTVFYPYAMALMRTLTP